MRTLHQRVLGHLAAHGWTVTAPTAGVAPQAFAGGATAALLGPPADPSAAPAGWTCEA